MAALQDAHADQGAARRSASRWRWYESACATPTRRSSKPSTSTFTAVWGSRFADRSAALLSGSPPREATRRCHEQVLEPNTTTPRAPDLQEHRGDRVSEGRHATYAHACRPADTGLVWPDAVSARARRSALRHVGGQDEVHHSLLMNDCAVLIEREGQGWVPWSSGRDRRVAG